MRLASISVYPVKSAAGYEPTSAVVRPEGLDGDRRWMLATPDGRFLTRREEAGLARIRAVPDGDGLRIEVDGESIAIPQPIDADRAMPVRIWQDAIYAFQAPGPVSTWIGERLGRAVRLVHVPDRRLRPVDPVYGRPGDRVGFADGFPLLLVSTASVDALSGQVGRRLAPRRFRPNLVVEGSAPFAEDGWRRIRVGSVEFDVVKPCKRCVVIDQDPDSGEPDAGVLRALGRFRRVPGGVLFGENLIPRSEGTVRVGDPVEVLAVREAGQRPFPL